MKKVLVGVTVALALVTSHAAADGIDRRPPPGIAAPVPLYPPSWSGFYIGGGVGAAAAFTDVSVHDRIFDERLFDINGGNDSVLGTVIIGWDWQIGQRTVFGVFADYDFFDMSGHHRAFDGAFDASMNHENAWSVGARLGFLSSPSTLWYVTGGYTQLEIDHSARFVDFDGLNVSRDRRLDGFFVGGGVDTRLAASNWFLRLEYRFSDFDTGRIRLTDDDGDIDMRVNTDTHMHTARLSLTYKFTPLQGWGGMGAWGPNGYGR